MTPDETIKELYEIGGPLISRSTLLRIEKQIGLNPVRGCNGRGAGRFTDYPPDTPIKLWHWWRARELNKKRSGKHAGD